MIDDFLKNRPFIIAEVAQAHDGSLGNAHAFITAAAAAGADAVKFQTHIAGEESTLDEPWRVKFSLQDDTRYGYWKRMEFTEEQWKGLANHAAEEGLEFLSSPFSVKAVELLSRVGVRMWKIPSGEVTNMELLDAVFEAGGPVLFSSGMSRLSELEGSVGRAREMGVPFGVFQCTTAYPCAPSRWGLNMVGELRERYGCPVGFSDHSGTIFAGLAAASLGADMIEVHVTFSRYMFGPDVTSSVTFEELAELVRGGRMIRSSLDSPVDKDALAEEFEGLRKTFGRSLALKEDLPAGTVLTEDMLTLKKPGSGIPHSAIGEVAGRRLARDKGADRLLAYEDLEEGE